MANISIGQVGKPYFDETNDRTKALIPKVFENCSQIEICLRRMLDQARGSRVTVRIFAGHDISLGDLAKLQVNGADFALKLESSLPCNCPNRLNIAYFGANTPERISSPAILKKQQTLLQTADGHAGPHQVDDCYRLRFNKGGKGWTPRDVNNTLEVYRQAYSSYLTSFTAVSVRRMLAENWVAAYDYEGDIVAIGVAEVAKIRIDKYFVTISEISEVATHPDHRSNGLAKGIYRRLAAELRGKGINLIFTETRANHGAILATALSAGFTPQGLLPQHCVLTSPATDVEQTSAYADLVPFYLP